MKVTRKQIADAFRLAKSRLWDGRGTRGFRSWFICLALDEDPAGNEAKQIIMQRLGGEMIVDHWLINRGFISTMAPDYDLIVQDYRHRWLDALIEEFSS